MLFRSLWASDRRGLERFVSLQLQWSLAVREGERELVPACRAFGLGTLVWSPLARGFLSGKYQRGQAAPEGSRLATWRDSFKQFDNDRCWAVVEELRAVARRRESTPAAVALAWLLTRAEVSAVLVGARDVRQLEENLQALEVKLEAADLAALEAASAPDWGYPYSFIGAREPW